MLYDNVKRLCEEKGVSILSLEKVLDSRVAAFANGMKMNLESARFKRLLTTWGFLSRSCWQTRKEGERGR